MSSSFDQQPIQRTVGRRKIRDGQPMSAEDRLAMGKNARYLTRAPKGVLIYRSHEEMDADRTKWLIEAMLDKGRKP